MNRRAKRGERTVRRFLVFAALASVLSACGGAVGVGSTVYSTTEAIATAVKDAIEDGDETEREE